MFDLDRLLEECERAGGEAEPRLAIREVLQRALADPAPLVSALEPVEAEITVLHRADDLTVVKVVWAPNMYIYPHDHRMWAAIGVYAGAEDNSFYRRGGPDRSHLVESGGRRLNAGDVLVLGDDAVHAVTNPRDHLTAAIHVYGGDFVGQPRSQWDGESSDERPFDFEDTRRQFAEANRAWREGR